ncbi:MAG: hypothetical protein RIC18_04260 [Hoeflea sp.]|uniref:hypothetical protein n=1 Tax=Hoeflea sp. TaxID=1940281 RepID=UPI0032EE64BF
MIAKALWRVSLVSACLFGGPSQIVAQSSDPAWLDDLSAQLAREKQCAVEYYLNIREGDLAGRLTFEARAQCADGRQFDAARTEPDRTFAISECGVQVC